MSETKTIVLSSELSESLIQQVHISACMMNQIVSHNAKLAGVPVPATRSIHSIVLENGVGRFCTANRWFGIHRGRQKLCYTNATRLVLSNPDRFIYMEGYGVRPSLGIVVGEHAWVLDAENGFAVIDPTWRDTKGSAYLGIPFSSDYLRKQIIEHRRYGLLDAPWGRWPVRRLPSAEWLHPKAAELPRDFTVPENMADPTVALETINVHSSNG